MPRRSEIRAPLIELAARGRVQTPENTRPPPSKLTVAHPPKQSLMPRHPSSAGLRGEINAVPMLARRRLRLVIFAQGGQAKTQTLWLLLSSHVVSCANGYAAGGRALADGGTSRRPRARGDWNRSAASCGCSSTCSSEMGDHLARGRLPFRRERVFRSKRQRTGVGSVPLVAMVSFFLGPDDGPAHGLRVAHLTGMERLVPELVAVGVLPRTGAADDGHRPGRAHRGRVHRGTRHDDRQRGGGSHRGDGHRAAAFPRRAAAGGDCRAAAVSGGRVQPRRALRRLHHLARFHAQASP